MSRKSKISAAIKEQTVKLCSAGKLSRREAAHRIGVDVKTIQSWSYRYASEGSDGLKDSDSNRIYPPELKRQAVLPISLAKAVNPRSAIFFISVLKASCALG